LTEGAGGRMMGGGRAVAGGAAGANSCTTFPAGSGQDYVQGTSAGSSSTGRPPGRSPRT